LLLVLGDIECVEEVCAGAVNGTTTGSLQVRSAVVCARLATGAKLLSSGLLGKLLARTEL
jgi:hypothetical protein